MAIPYFDNKAICDLIEKVSSRLTMCCTKAMLRICSCWLRAECEEDTKVLRVDIQHFPVPGVCAPLEDHTMPVCVQVTYSSLVVCAKITSVGTL